MKRAGSAVAEISTGARKRNENGFCSPPVKYSRPASSTMFSASSPAACIGSSRCSGLDTVWSARLSAADKAMMLTQGTISTLNSNPCATMKIAASWPSTASQRSRRIVSRRICRCAWRKSEAAISVISANGGAFQITNAGLAEPPDYKPCAIRCNSRRTTSMTENDKASSRPTVAERSSSAAIAVEHLVKIYKQTRAVDDISFSLPRGSITGLLGGNGAGKTTTIAMIMGLVLPTSGRVQVLGHRMPEESASVLGRMNFESPYVDMPMRLTVRQNLTVFGKLYAVKNLAGRIAELADDLDLTEFIDRANGKLSAGQKTRVALAKALVNRPELLLLDEPTASLDPDTADWVRAHLERYRKDNNATILLASHNMLEVERLCDRVIIMKRGRIEDDDTPEAIMARYNRTTLEEVFLDVARGRVNGAKEAAR
ncbi:ABC-type multidrug transport system ATPase subunit [Bradyrhizobium ottawaense]